MANTDPQLPPPAPAPPPTSPPPNHTHPSTITTTSTVTKPTTPATESPTFWTAFKTIRPSDFFHVHKLPCVRDALLTGITTGFAFGGLKLILRSTIPVAANWAAGTFCGSSLVVYEACQYRRWKERKGVKRAVEIVQRKDRQRRLKVAGTATAAAGEVGGEVGGAGSIGGEGGVNSSRDLEGRPRAKTAEAAVGEGVFTAMDGGERGISHPGSTRSSPTSSSSLSSSSPSPSPPTPTSKPWYKFW